MDTTEIIKKAIELKKPIEFEYSREDKIRGKRVGNSHAIFYFIAEIGEKSIKVHIVQTSGVSDSEKPFPSFRMFNLENLIGVKILEEMESFQTHEDYNPDWEGYEHIIAKI